MAIFPGIAAASAFAPRKKNRGRNDPGIKEIAARARRRYLALI
jgi:hypothetical protein